ncbi:MAG: formylglycine-generating enzyme family protein [Helicobacteraceae bacterium]|jgi:formylglycine-generating enzyme required for sulfatase activity|nr:formylglycine-generating enzyme family protein [Helicobacteraceae bacterium]
MRLLILSLALFLYGCGPEEEENNEKTGCDALTSLEQSCKNTATDIELVLIPSGKFIMGTDETENAHENENPSHEVNITQPFYIGVYEVTQSQWSAIKGGARGNDPVSDVSWAAIADTNGFIAQLNAEAEEIVIDGVHYEYALPSEAQWEYAARGGSNSLYSWGDRDDGGEYAWFKTNTNQTRAVGSKEPNNLGLYDTSGNVAEWVQDCYAEYTDESKNDPIVNDCSIDRVFRGGSYNDSIDDLRITKRDKESQEYRSEWLGFRLALVPKR